MFGFGKGENPKDKETNREEVNAWRLYIPGAMSNTFGTTDPKKINQIWHKYMPEITNAILNTENFAIANNKSINVVYENLLHKLERLEKQNIEAQRKNQELQEKYNALVERMAGYIERENGKGR